jgi:hypothetical protein
MHNPSLETVQFNHKIARRVQYQRLAERTIVVHLLKSAPFWRSVHYCGECRFGSRPTITRLYWNRHDNT